MSTIAKALSPEWSILLASAAVVDTHDEVFSEACRTAGWDLLLRHAEQHGLTFLLYKCLSANEATPAETRQFLAASYQQNVRKTLVLAREFFRILDALQQSNIDVLPYKGITLAETLYGDMAARPAGDIDLLIRATDFPKTKETFRQLGYVPHMQFSPAEEQAYLSSGYECAFDGPGGRNLVEVQWALQSRFYAVDLDTNSFFGRSLSASVAGRTVRTLCPEDMFVVLSLHAAKHLWSRLIWISDIARLISRHPLNWQQISEEAEQLAIVRILRVSLLLAQHLLAADIPSDAQAELAADPGSQRIAAELANQIFSGTSCPVESLAYFRFMLKLRERRSDRIRFLQRLIFTPGPGEWKTIKLPASLFPLYRLVRLSRLAARVGRPGKIRG